MVAEQGYFLVGQPHHKLIGVQHGIACFAQLQAGPFVVFRNGQLLARHFVAEADPPSAGKHDNDARVGIRHAHEHIKFALGLTGRAALQGVHGQQMGGLLQKFHVKCLIGEYGLFSLFRKAKQTNNAHGLAPHHDGRADIEHFPAIAQVGAGAANGVLPRVVKADGPHGAHGCKVQLPGVLNAFANAGRIAARAAQTDQIGVHDLYIHLGDGSQHISKGCNLFTHVFQWIINLHSHMHLFCGLSV